MSKTENPVSTTPTQAGTVPADRLPERVVDNIANALKFKEKWAEMKKNGGETMVNIPGTRTSVNFKHVEVKSNVVSIRTSSDTSQPADFVIVNGPTEVVNGNGIIVEDHLTAIALAIHGATK